MRQQLGFAELYEFAASEKDLLGYGIVSETASVNNFDCIRILFE